MTVSSAALSETNYYQRLLDANLASANLSRIHSARLRADLGISRT